jgi:NAD(P)-dependent dehydrogenase (short-subunit alcohol dehydrogenase family)
LIQSAAVAGTEPTGLRVLVTGASGGLGTAIVDHLSATGCRLATLDREPPLSTSGTGVGPSFHSVDLADPEAIVTAVGEAVEALGGCDAVVLAAGIVDTLHRAESFTDADWETEITVNLTGAFRVARACFPALRAAGGGRVVAVSSTAATEGQPAQVAYAASKAGLIGMICTLAAEWAPQRITCNVVMPGMIETPKVAALSDGVRSVMLGRVPLGRFAMPAEIAGCIAFLLSPAAAPINGTVLRVDGGAFLNQTALVGVGRGERT